MRKYGFQSVHQHLSNNFVKNIEKANRPKLRDFFGVFFTLGIKEMKVEFMESGIIPSFRIARASLEVRTKRKNLLPLTKLKT